MKDGPSRMVFHLVFEGVGYLVFGGAVVCVWAVAERNDGERAVCLTEADYAHMRKVTGYIKRHSAQRPKGDVSHTRWRYSLMNWGHDPLKK